MSDAHLTRRDVNLCQGLLPYDVLSLSLVMRVTDLHERQATGLLSKLEKNAILSQRRDCSYAFTKNGKNILFSMYVYGLPKPRQTSLRRR
jgi:hypothetical protein